MKILSIGNSFSQDSHIYTKRLSDSVGTDFEVLNLYIGGCSLETHAKNVLENNRAYEPEYNGKSYAEKPTSIEEALKFRDWDYVSIQQVSGLSGIYETFQPYANTVVSKIREIRPKAKLLVHETWAYEYGSSHGDFLRYDSNPALMTERLISAYAKLKEDVNAVGTVPTGRVIAALKKLPEFDVRVGGESLHRDGFHLSLSYGRFAAAAVWVHYLGACDVEKCDALPDGDNLDQRKISLIKRTVKETVVPLS